MLGYMTPNLSSSTSPFLSLSCSPLIFLRRPPPAAGPTGRRASSPFVVRASNPCNWRPLGFRSLSLGDLPPPWFVHPPDCCSSSSDGELHFGLPARSSSAGSVPLSLRIVQLKKKMTNLSRKESPGPPVDHLGGVGKAVLSLASAMEEIQQAVLSDVAAARATAESVVFLFGSVYCTSPDFVVGLLVLASDFLVASVEKEMAFPPVPIVGGGGYGSWFDIGILDAGEGGRTQPGESENVAGKRRARAYENMIASGMTSSLILCNYAQLLYKYERDIERANYYFKWATNEEPEDAEVMNKYASFLWQAVGDLEAAEEMFLSAIEAESRTYYYESAYAFFLWSTGGLDTCYPID